MPEHADDDPRRTAALDLRAVAYDHPDALALTARAQLYYARLYGGPDVDPLTAVDFVAPTGGFLVGYADDEPVAMGGWTLAGGHGAGRAQLRRMFVGDEVRRRGWARVLLAALEAGAVANGARQMILSTGRPQVEAIAFYRRCGYTDIPPFGYYATSDQVVCLARTLT